MPDTVAVQTGAAEGIQLWELLLKGGWVMIPLAALSLLAIYLFIERWIVIRRASKTDPSFFANIRDLIYQGNIEGALTLCRNHSSPIARILEKGLARLGKSLKNIEVAIENAGKLEVARLEKNLAGLATISGAAPMLGFLGTVTGMIRAFHKLHVAGQRVDPSMLAGGIYEALITTAAGLAIGIVAYVAYNYLVVRIEHIVYQMEVTAVDFLDMLQEPAGTTPFGSSTPGGTAVSQSTGAPIGMSSTPAAGSPPHAPPPSVSS